MAGKTMKGLRCRKGWYFYEFRDPQKVPARREYPLRTRDMREAVQIAGRYWMEYVAGTFDPWKDVRRGREALLVVVQAFMKTKRRQTEQTQRAYRSTLELFADTCSAASPDAIKEKHIEAFVLGNGGGERQKGKIYTVKTQQAHLQRLSTFLRWCVSQGYAQDNSALTFWQRLDREQPKRKKKAQPRRDFLMPDEITRLSATIGLDGEGRTLERGGRTYSRAYLQAMIELACCTGLRESEVCNLNREHVRLRYVETSRGMQPLAGQLIVANYEDDERGEIETKTGAERMIPIVPRAALLLSNWMDKAIDEDPAAPVFTSPRAGRRVDPHALSEGFKEYRQKTKLRSSLTFHSTRHTYVSWLLMLGLPIYHVKELAGHSGLRITEQYAHTARRYLHGQAREIMQAMLTFYCPGLEPEKIATAIGAGLHGGGLAAYAWGGASLLDVLFGASLYRPDHKAEQMPERAPEYMFKGM